MAGEIDMQARCIPYEEHERLQREIGRFDNSEWYAITSFLVFITKFDYHDV
jgi:hypothetical protein